MLGFDVSERTISRWVKRAARYPEPAKRWLTFLRNHREAIAAMDFAARVAATKAATARPQGEPFSGSSQRLQSTA